MSSTTNVLINIPDSSNSSTSLQTCLDDNYDDYDDYDD